MHPILVQPTIKSYHLTLGPFYNLDSLYRLSFLNLCFKRYNTLLLCLLPCKYGCCALSTRSTSGCRRVNNMNHFGLFVVNHISIWCTGKTMALKSKRGCPLPIFMLFKACKRSSNFKSACHSAKHYTLPRCPE